MEKYNLIVKKGYMKVKWSVLCAALITYHLSLITSSCSDPNEGSLFMTPTTEEAEMSATDILERDAAQYSLWTELLKHANYYNARGHDALPPSARRR